MESELTPESDKKQDLDIAKQKPWHDPVTKKFGKGNPGGPGRPKDNWLELRIILKNKLKEQVFDESGKIRTRAEQLIEILLKKALDGDTSAIKEIFDRIEKRPRPSFDLAPQDEKVYKVMVEIVRSDENDKVKSFEMH